MISDIVKRRSIRVLDREGISNQIRTADRGAVDAISSSFRCDRCVPQGARQSRRKTTLLATLDRIAIGPILRSNLVFLIYVCCCNRVRLRMRMTQNRSAENVWTSIMRAIKCLKGVRWMPWR